MTSFARILPILAIVVLLASGNVNGILQTFVNYIYWGPSGYTARSGVCPGNDLEFLINGTVPDSDITATATAEECAQRCNDMQPSCVGFTYSSTSKHCILKSKSCGSTVIDDSNEPSMTFDIYNGTGCPVGFFGWNCSYYCSCNNNDICNPIDGSCPSGCKEHTWGWGCSLINSCFYDNEGGASYKGTRYNAISGAMCQPWEQRQPHNHNLTDEDVPDGSLNLARNFCRNPKGSSVTTPSTEPWCYVLDKADAVRETCYVKKCSCEFGRYGVNCEQECPEGRYGQDCRFQCSCNPDETCSKLTGKCQKCPPGYFGSGCLRRCHCRDSSEVCDYRSGSCTQCAEGFGGVDCYTKLPFLSKNPWVSKRTPSSLTLSWQGWFSCHVSGGCGEGPINGYIIEYHPKNAAINKWIQTLVSANTTDIEFNNLHDDVIYEMRVTPIHAVWLQGIASTPVEFQLCGDPKNYPTEVAFFPKCNTQFCEAEISFKKISNLTEVNCDLSKVTYMISFAQIGLESEGKTSAYSTVTCSAIPETDGKVGNTADACRVSLGRLSPGSTYSVKACASSAKSVPVYMKRLSETMLDKKCGPVYTTTVRTPYAEPTAPRNISASQVTSRRATIEWQSPEQPGSPLSLVTYTVELKENKVRACRRVSSSPVQTIQANQTSVAFEQLKPYTEYSVTIVASNPDATSKAIAKFQFTTMLSPPEAKLTTRISNIGSNFAQVAVTEPQCELVHGEITGYRYELATKTNKTTFDVGTTNGTTFRLDALEPFTEYILRVHVVNEKGPGVPSEPLKFTTDEAKPAEPKRLEIRNVSANSLQVEVMMPQNPRAQIRYIELKLIDLDNATVALDGAKKDILRVGATDKTISLAELRPNTKYRVQVRTVADTGVSEWTEPIIIRTKKDRVGTSLEDAMAAVYGSSTVMNSMPLIAGVIVSILFVILIFSGVAAFVIMYRRRISRSMVPTTGTGSSLSRSCTSAGTSSPSSSTAADDVQGRWRTIPHFLQEMKSEQMIYATQDVIGMCDSPPSSFMPIGGSKQIISVHTESSASSSSASPDSSSSGASGGLLKKVPMPPPRPSGGALQQQQQLAHPHHHHHHHHHHSSQHPHQQQHSHQYQQRQQQQLQQQQRPPVAPRPSLAVAAAAVSAATNQQQSTINRQRRF